VPDCRRVRWGKSLASAFDLVKSNPTTPDVEAVAATNSVVAARIVGVDTILTLKIDKEVWQGITLMVSILGD